MKRISMYVFILATEAVFCSLVNAEPSWVTLDFPGADQTRIRDIDGDNMVGIYQVSGYWQNFLYNGKDWTTLESGHTPWGVDGDSVVGDSGTHAFLYDGVDYVNFDAPGAWQTRARGIDGDKIVGIYSTYASESHGFLYDGTNWTTLDLLPGAPALRGFTPVGIDGDTILIASPDAGFNYLYDGLNWTHLNMPVWASGIDGDDILGYVSYYGHYYGYLYDGADYTVLEAPAAAYYPGTIAYGIDDNKVVGWYYDTSRLAHGFVCTLDTAVVPVPNGVLLGFLGLSVAGIKLRKYA